MKMWKVLRRDDSWSEKLTWAYSSGELKIDFKKKDHSKRGGVYVNYYPRLFTLGSAAKIDDVAHVIEKMLPLLDFIALYRTADGFFLFKNNLTRIKSFDPFP